MTYRRRIYEKYASVAQGAELAPNLAEMDRWGTAYDAYLRGWLPTARDATIVDVACGYGRLLRFFTQRGYTNVTGVDVSPEQVAIGRRVHANVLQGDVLEFLEGRPGSFALITAFDVLEHLDKDEALRFQDVERREQGPVPRGLASSVRYLLWQVLRLSMLARNLVETGSRGSAILTRVFIARARRP